MDPLAALTSLGDSTRRRIYDHVAAHPGPLSRDEVTRALGIGRTLAAYHLDRLAAEGLLEVTYERRSGRSGPGAGRPAKLYARTEREVSVTVPPRDYPLAARLLADAAAADPGGHVRRSLTSAAERLGREIAAQAGTLAGEGRPGDAGAADLDALLRERGYEPFDDDGATRLRNCPFHAVAQRQPELVCDMNLALLRGLADGLDGLRLTARLEPAPGRCCVALHRDRTAQASEHEEDR
jgi:predicted ArsR family transcriptional regulator